MFPLIVNTVVLLLQTQKIVAGLLGLIHGLMHESHILTQTRLFPPNCLHWLIYINNSPRDILNKKNIRPFAHITVRHKHINMHVSIREQPPVSQTALGYWIEPALGITKPTERLILLYLFIFTIDLEKLRSFWHP